MRKLGCIVVITAWLIGATASQATLLKSFQFNGKGNWSLDAVGSNNSETSIGDLRAVVPPGSTVVKAFLYCSRTPGGSGTKPTIVLDGTTYGPSAWTALGINVSGSGLQAFRADVTTQVAAKIGSGSASTNTFDVDSEDLNDETDGEVLAIVYSNGSEVTRTIAFLDGESESSGDSVKFNFASALSMGTGFEALMSLGIGFSFQASGQFSQVDVNGRRLTTSAGGQDDGAGEDGALITAGGIGDDPANPADPFAEDDAGTRADDELYDLAQGNATNSAPFLVNGIKFFTVDTQNPSDNDNIFFMGLNVTAKGSVTGSGGNGSCSSASDLLSQVDALGLPRGQTKRLEREVVVIGKAVSRRNPHAARANCGVLTRYLTALVRSGAIDSSAASSIESCCDSFAATASTGGSGGGGGGD
jgi:hypothetical protein